MLILKSFAQQVICCVGSNQYAVLPVRLVCMEVQFNEYSEGVLLLISQKRMRGNIDSLDIQIR